MTRTHPSHGVEEKDYDTSKLVDLYSTIVYMKIVTTVIIV